MYECKKLSAIKIYIVFASSLILKDKGNSNKKTGLIL
jgi:hypothetical protein